MEFHSEFGLKSSSAKTTFHWFPSCSLLQVQRELEQARYELTQLQEELVSHGLTDQLLLLFPPAAAGDSCRQQQLLPSLPSTDLRNMSSSNTVDLVCSTDSAR